MKHNETFVEAFTKILSKNNIIKPSEEQALKKSFAQSSQESFDDFLISEGLVSRKNILDALSRYYNIPSFDVQGYFFNHRILHEFPKEFLMRNRVIPIGRDENMLFVVANNPADEELLPQFGSYVSYDIQFRVGIAQDILDAIEEYYDASPTEVPEDVDLRHERQEEEQAERMMLGDTEE